MKRLYILPKVSLVRMNCVFMIAQSINRASGTTNIQYGGLGTADNGGMSSRVKEQHTYNVWDDDWQTGK